MDEFEIDLGGPFTIDEIIEIEEMTGRPITDLLSGPRGRALRAVAYVTGRRANPQFTLAEAGQLMVKIDA